MKISKKLRILFSLTSLLICLCMSSVLVNADVLPMEEETTLSAEDAKTYANGKITLGEAKNIVEQMATAISQFSACTGEELEYVADAMSYQTDIYTNFANTVGDEGSGAYISYDNVKVEEMEENKVDVVADMHFEKMNLKMTLHVSCYETIGAQVTSTEFSLADAGEESFGSKMMTALSNTLMGMGTVFVVLIFISLIISCFSFIPKITEKYENRKNRVSETGTVSNAEQNINEPQTQIIESDNTELIAVIAAAIAASEQISTDSFVVRTIKKR